MADIKELLRSKHGFGSSDGIEGAIEAGKLDEYDILFLDGETEPKVGWIDKNGNVRIVDTEKVIVVKEDVLPKTGVEGKVYIFNGEGYFWDGAKFVNLSKPTDLTAFESQINELETEIKTKVTSETVQTMIDDVFQVIEF